MARVSVGSTVVLLCISLVSSADRSVGTFWQLTDIHFDPWYLKGADVFNTKCHNITSDANETAGPFGHYHCPSPYVLVHSMFEHMATVAPSPDFIVWTGDDSPMNEKFPEKSPDLHMSQERVYGIVQNLTSTIRHYFPRTPVLPCLGNHEVWAPSQLHGLGQPGTQSLFHTIGNMWKDWIPDASAVSQLQANGSFTYRLSAGHRIISLNTLWCDDGNVIADVGLDGGGNKALFAWLSEVLAQAKRDHDICWVIGHVPMAHGTARHACVDPYVDLLVRYNNTVRAQLYGHTHKDSWILAHHQGRPVHVTYTAPSGTPESWHEVGQNPAVRMYKYDRVTKEIVDYTQYYVDLPSSNAAGVLEWKVEYTAREAYNLTDLTAASWSSFAARLSTDKTAFDQVYTHFRTSRSPTPPCDDDCRQKHVCSIQHMRRVDYEACLHA